MTYFVLGAGLQGPAVAYALTVLSPDAEIFVVENDKQRMARAKWVLKNLGVAARITYLGVNFATALSGARERTDATILSTLPYFCNEEVAKTCLKRGWRYYDLGGHIQTSEKIAQMAMDADSQVPVMTDLGLAPGLVNIIGEYALKQLPGILGVEMYCGGLPVDPTKNELNYGIVFSPEGLVNEYFNDCEALVDGKIVPVEPMGDHRTTMLGDIAYESFNTSGGAHTTLETARQLGAKYCSYQTLRHFGHAKIMRFLKHDIGMTNKQIAELVEEKIGRIKEDKVLVAVRAINVANSKYETGFVVYHDDNFTAMQKATGYSMAAMVKVTENIWDKPLCTYADVDAQKLIELLRHDDLLPEATL